MSGRREADPEFTTRLQCMVVFVEVEPRKLRLDSLQVEPVNAPGIHLDKGTPFTVTADLPVRKSGMARVRATDGQPEFSSTSSRRHRGPFDGACANADGCFP